MAKSYVGDIGTIIRLDTKQDISTGTSFKIKYRKPNGDESEWVATRVGTKVKYTIQSGDLDDAGNWILQAYVVMPTWTGLGDSINWRIYDPFE